MGKENRRGTRKKRGEGMRERKRNEKGEEMMIGPHGISHAPLRELESARYAWGFGRGLVSFGRWGG